MKVNNRSVPYADRQLAPGDVVTTILRQRQRVVNGAGALPGIRTRG
jgi:hypothetical protein